MARGDSRSRSGNVIDPRRDGSSGVSFWEAILTTTLVDNDTIELAEHVIRRGHGCPASKPYALVSKSTGRVLGCHESKGSAMKQEAAIKASGNWPFAEHHVRTQGIGHAATLHGRPFRVVPAVLVRSQVLRNNLGRSYLPATEFTEEWAEAWNGIPVLVGDHPQQRGEEVSGRNPALWDERQVGWIFNARVEQEGRDVARLVAEVWLDETRAEAVQGLQAILEAVRAGRPVELSTGFRTRTEQSTGQFGGEAYELIMHPVAPDHLVISTEMTGACSVSDGCGLGVNEGAAMTEPTDLQAGLPEGPVWVTQEEMQDVCPDCAEEMRSKNIARLNITELMAGNQVPERLLQGLCRSIGSDPGFFTRCRAKSFGDFTPSDKNRFCNFLQNACRRHVSIEPGPGVSRSQREGGVKGLLARVAALFEAKPFSMTPEEHDALRVKRLLEAANEIHQHTDGERMQLLREALQEQFGSSDRQVVIADVFSTESRVVYWWTTPMGPFPKGAAFFMSTWTAAGDGKITFSEPETVRRMTTYEPVATQAAEQSASFAGVAAATNLVPETGKGDEMSDKEKDLAAQVASLVAAVQALTADVAAIKTAAEKDPNPAIAGLKTQIGKLTDEFARMREVTEAAVAERERERQELVRQLAGHYRVPFDQAQLEAKPLGELRQLMQMAQGVNFEGRGGPHGADEEKSYVEPVSPWSKQGKKEGE